MSGETACALLWSFGFVALGMIAHGIYLFVLRYKKIRRLWL